MSVTGDASALLTVLALCGCAASPRPLVANEDACDFCRMTVVDVRIGGEVLSAGGRLRTFDSITCLIGFLRSGPPGGERGVWVADYATGGMVPANSAHFLRSSSIRSPMGRDGDLVAFAPTVPDRVLVARYGGTVVTWPEALAARENQETPSVGADVVPAPPPKR